MMVGIFPNLEDEVLLNCKAPPKVQLYFLSHRHYSTSLHLPYIVYPCTYWANESASVRGQLFITRNYVCFHGPRPPPPFPDNVATSLCLPFKDVLSVDIETAKRLLQPDQMIIGIKEKKVNGYCKILNPISQHILCI